MSYALQGSPSRAPVRCGAGSCGSCDERSLQARARRRRLLAQPQKQGADQSSQLGQGTDQSSQLDQGRELGRGKDQGRGPGQGQERDDQNR